MPRPRHPIREHFDEIPESTRKNGAISCKYCGKEQSAGNPKRCQKHLDECKKYAQFLDDVEAGRIPQHPYHSPFDSPTPNHTEGQNGASSYSHLSGFEATPQTHHNGYTQSPLAGHERMDEEQIMLVLNIDQHQYLDFERELDAQMMALNISGAGLLTDGGRNLLKQAFYHINKQFPAILNRIAEENKQSALTSMAYIANRKRRNGHPPNSASSPSGLPRRTMQQSSPQGTLSSTTNGLAQPVAPLPAPHQPSGPFGLTTIIAERDEPGGAFVICRPGDLVDSPKPAEEITVSDVKFMPFIHLLQHDDDVMFDAAGDDRIIHTFTGGRTKTVSNEVVWRVALEEMHRNGTNPFLFKIYKRPREATTEKGTLHP